MSSGDLINTDSKEDEEFNRSDNCCPLNWQRKIIYRLSNKKSYLSALFLLKEFNVGTVTFIKDHKLNDSNPIKHPFFLI